MRNVSSLVITIILVIIFVLPSVYLNATRGTRVINVLFFDADQYVFMLAPLTENICNKRAGNRVHFRFKQGGETIDAYDGCIIGAAAGDVVKVYYNKKDVFDNGIVRVLIKDWLIVFIGFILMNIIIEWRLVDNYLHPPRPLPKKAF